MANYIVTDAELISVANSIRAKSNTENLLSWPQDFITTINNINENNFSLLKIQIDDNGNLLTYSDILNLQFTENGMLQYKLKNLNPVIDNNGELNIQKI